MKREEYLKDLKLKLEQDDFAQVEEAITYFNDLLEDRMADEGMDEDAAVASMEPVDKVAAQLREGPEKARAGAEAESIRPGVREITARADQVRRVYVRDRNMRLTVIGEEREDILIRHPESEKVRYQFSLQDGTLSLIREQLPLTWQLFTLDGLSREMWEVTLRVPREMAAGMDLRTSNAKLTLENFSCWGGITAAASNAALSLANTHAKSMALKTSNGTLALSGVSAQLEIKAATSNARLQAKGASSPILNLKTSNASIAVEAIKSNDITLTTSNGAIKGELPGQMADWSITSRTSNGKNSLPPLTTGGGKRLSAHTSNAGISLGFTGGAAE